jgi:transcriptional regulator with XRE-family HTH domain
MLVSERLREARNRAGLRQEDLANKLGVSTVTVTLWENHKNPRQIAPKYLPKLAQILDMEISDLVADRQHGLSALDQVETVLLRAFRSMPEKMKLFQLAQIIECASVSRSGHTQSEDRRAEEVPALSVETSESR